MNRLLIVDDDKAHLHTVGAVLESRFEVTLVEDAEEALRVIEMLGKIHAVISDLDLPGMNGADLLARVREANAAVRRILMSGRINTPGFNPASVQHAEAHVLLPKPVTVKVLRESV